MNVKPKLRQNTTSIRLPAPFLAEVKSACETLGVSVNSMVAIALRKYLDVHHPCRFLVDSQKGPA